MPAQVITIELPGAPGPVGPRGDPGPNGLSNTLTIGTVAGGASASATITGTAPNQTLNLVLPKGDPGVAGPAAAMTIGTVSTGAPGSNATATITGSAPNYSLNLTIPRGDAGSAGAVISTNITDSSVTGRSILTAADAPAVRAIIGAVVLGTTSATAAAGNHTHSDLTAATSVSGGGTLVKRATDNTFTIGQIHIDNDPVTDRQVAPKIYIDNIQNVLSSRIDEMSTQPGGGGGGAVYGINPDVANLPDGTQVYMIVTEI